MSLEGGGGEGRGGEGSGWEGRGGREGGREEGGRGGMTVIHNMYNSHPSPPSLLSPNIIILIDHNIYIYNNDVTYYVIT